MADQIDVNTVIEQLVGRIAQLELEVALLTAALNADKQLKQVVNEEGEKGEPENGGYM